jgi:hypothetical protein
LRRALSGRRTRVEPFLAKAPLEAALFGGRGTPAAIQSRAVFI